MAGVAGFPSPGAVLTRPTAAAVLPPASMMGSISVAAAGQPSLTTASLPHSIPSLVPSSAQSSPAQPTFPLLGGAASRLPPHSPPRPPSAHSPAPMIKGEGRLMREMERDCSELDEPQVTQ